MITFKNITGNKFLAVGTIQRKSALNGEKSLTGTLYDGDDVLNKIDKGWSLEFDNEPYIVTYFERNDNDNSVSFDAIHKFFWDMAKNVLYSETSGSHTIKWYLDQIFADAGYTYELNFNPNAIAKDNWGMKNKLSLFNDIITSIEGEFEINGTLVSIFKNIGTDLSTIVRYGFNLSDMTIENDASGFVTYGEGFGAYADQENMTGDRLHVTYTSPLASVYGKLQAEPIDDQRYTIESNLLDAVKSQVDGSFSISVNLSLYDLSVAGYPYKMANVGDWLTAVDENLDFKQRIRIISIDDEFAADGTRISYSVTAGDIGLTKKYQDANASIANKVEYAVISAGQAATDANIALIAANGKNKSYYLNDINDLPKTANEGDLAWVQSGDGRVLYIYTKKADGTYYWEKRIDPEMGEQIEAGVNEAIAQANENTVTAIEQNNISQKEVMNDIAKSQADLAIKDGDFNNKAQAMADKALQDANENTATVSKSTLDSANKNIADAKKSLTDGINKEVLDRLSAVSALDTRARGYADDAKKSATDGIAQEAKDRATAVSTVDKSAKGYADQAKQDAVDVATSADGVINKKIDDTASSLTSTISQNKIDANGKISTAQSTATQALNGLSTKVEKTDYDKKTGDLTTQLNTTTATATQSKQDIVDIKSTNSSQNSKINSIVSDATKTQQTISDIQKSQSTQSDKLNQITTDVNGTKQEITDIKTKDGQQDTRMGTIETSVSGVKSDFSTYQKSNDGSVKAAQTTAQTAVDGLKTKVSQTDYNAKTGQLTTDVTNVTQTANQAKTDIASIKQTDSKQDARMTTIEADADGTKTTVSNLQKTQNTQSGSISTLQQRADGFDATVAKVDNLAVGGRNLLSNTNKTFTGVGNNSTNGNFGATGTVPLINSWKASDLYANFGKVQLTLSFDWVATGSTLTGSFVPQFNSSPWGVFNTKGRINVTDKNGHYTATTLPMSDSWSSGTAANNVVFRQDGMQGTVNITNIKLEVGNVPSPWTPAYEDLSGATAKAQLTADQATTALNAYKTNADGRISKAQSDIIQTAKDVTTKVSQSDYNVKTGQLSTDVSNAQQTANSAVTTIGSYKTSNDNRVAAAETKISQNANDITLRATTSDLNAAKSDYTAQIAQIKVDAQAVTTTVTQVQTTVNKLNQNNLVNNSQFNPDYSGWHVGSPWGKSVTNELWNNGVETSTGAMWVWHDQSKSGDWIYSDPIAVYAGLKVSAAITAAMPSPPSSGTPLALYIRTYDANRNTVDSWGYNIPNGQLSGTFKKFSNDNRTLTTGVKYVSLCLAWNVSGQISFGKPMLMFGATTGDYVAGPYNNNDKVAAQQITIDGITNTVTQQGKNINSVTSRVQTAEGNISTATDNISGLQSKQTQTANQITQEITDRTKGDSNTLQSSKDFTQSSITSAVNGLNSTISQTANGILAQVESTNMVVNSEFDPLNGTFYRLTNGGSTGSQLAEVWSATQATGFADWPVVNGSRVVSYAVGTWYSSALVSTSAGKAFSASIVAGRSPAPTVSTALDYRIGFWDSSRKLLSTASAGNIIDGTAYKGIQKYVVENKTAPANTAFVSVIIAHSSANATDYICRPSLNTGAKASPYTPTYGTSSSSTILSLFKDNWSIGINDNISKITSGIVGNASQMSLISKNVTIDSPNTQIKGTAWIQSAMIANGAIGSAQIGDATITSAKIAQLDVAKLTGNVSSFIQSNWNGVYGSTAITSSGMTVTSPGTVALFNVNGMTLDGAGGMTRVANGFTQIYSATHENIGMIGHQKDKQHTNVDYIMFGLNGYRTTNEGDSHWVGGSDFYGGDGMGFGVSNKSGGYDLKLRWDSDLIAGYKGELQGWHASDQFIFDNKTFHKGYADFSGGVTLSGAYAEGTRSLHTQGMSISTGAKWFGFMDGSNSTGFGTDQTQDVLFYVKGQVYSLYTMLGKLGMR
ncbi:phage tail protein [Leuconostoc mesenteroides]|uniref:phage tail protein n=1 Tax=Leuconostoc mesenteroides TaxID=1245 RepID=UPI0022E6472D|nr:phage tail protein [Leuconostoc mesenteroides]